MVNALLFGASGQLGQCIMSVAGEFPHVNIVTPERSLANILDLNGLRKLFLNERPQYIINCAAYTAVDLAEDEVDLARKINRDGSNNLSKLCAEFRVKMVHISTDFVFGGDSVLPYSEEDVVNPINVYGLTKYEGEQLVSKNLQEHFIIRTSWLYSEFGNNFVKTMLKLGSQRSELKVIADQFGTPTYGVDLAKFILTVVSQRSRDYGIYHFSNWGTATWFDFARSIFQEEGMDVLVTPIPASEYITKAKRPSFSIMNKSKVVEKFGIQIPFWHDSLKTCLSKLKNIS